MSPWGMVLGLVAGAGLVALASWWRARRPRPLRDRVAPYLGRAAATALPRADLTITWREALPWLVRPLGRRTPADADHVDRLAWAAVGGGVGLVVGVLLASGTMGSVVLGGIGVVAGSWAHRMHGRHRLRVRHRAMTAHLPLLADLTALAVTAGATPVAALEAAAHSIDGPLADAVTSTVAEIRAGRPVESALHALADGTDLLGLRRLVDAMLIAVEHGTPVAAVARAQAEDLRTDRRRALMESAGRRDIAMLVPIVFLVLPAVVLVTLYPAVHSLRLVLP